jgi:hypothetical protein
MYFAAVDDADKVTPDEVLLLALRHDEKLPAALESDSTGDVGLR